MIVAELVTSTVDAEGKLNFEVKVFHQIIIIS